MSGLYERAVAINRSERVDDGCDGRNAVQPDITVFYCNLSGTKEQPGTGTGTDRSQSSVFAHRAP